MGSSSPQHTCLKLVISNKEQIFVKGTWFSSYFDLFITDGLHSWTCHASEEEVEERASQWDQPVSEYIDLGEKYLGFQQPGSVYGFDDAGTGHKRDEVVSKTESFERMKVEAEKCLTQSEKLSKEKEEFESAIYAKFLGVLNAKKKKLRELRDKLSKQATSVEEPVEEDAQSTDRTETFDEGSDEEISGEEVEKDDVGTSKGVPARRGRGRGRKRK
ncbi:DNA repair protein XRCC4 isoform X2 [Solanum pennellii]|uniref:DNA repair protein XRCC4 isoform X2 n=1 Tax=Solanum pennellii TaxID=28526 RepID=A0ABM1VDI8_SOLPN|nr:DNA repair protein XRCC4 isoform X2 [Solanum pennellii]